MMDPVGFVEGLTARIDGPMSLRMVVQPLVAVFFAIRDGRRDARERKSAYFWGLLTAHGQRRQMIRSGWQSIGKVFILAIILDMVFQYLTFHAYRPLGALLAGIILAIIPYLLLRGPINRLIRSWSVQADN